MITIKSSDGGLGREPHTLLGLARAADALRGHSVSLCRSSDRFAEYVMRLGGDNGFAVECIGSTQYGGSASQELMLHGRSRVCIDLSTGDGIGDFDAGGDGHGVAAADLEHRLSARVDRPAASMDCSSHRRTHRWWPMPSGSPSPMTTSSTRRLRSMRMIGARTPCLPDRSPANRIDVRGGPSQGPRAPSLTRYSSARCRLVRTSQVIVDGAGPTIPLLKYVHDPLRGAAVAVRERRPGHSSIGLAVLEELRDGVDDSVTVGADEGCVACLDGLATLGRSRAGRVRAVRELGPLPGRLPSPKG